MTRHIYATDLVSCHVQRSCFGIQISEDFSNRSIIVFGQRRVLTARTRQQAVLHFLLKALHVFSLERSSFRLLGPRRMGAKWQRIRSILNPRMLKPKHVLSYTHTINEVVTDFVDRVDWLRESSGHGVMVNDLAGELYKFAFEGERKNECDFHCRLHRLGGDTVSPSLPVLDSSHSRRSYQPTFISLSSDDDITGSLSHLFQICGTL